MLELTQTTDQQAIEENYPCNLTYRGEEFFNNIYMERLTDKADDVITVESQESYLGYIPEDDVFIEGYDTWQDEESHYIPNIVFLQIGKGRESRVRDVTKQMADKFGVDCYFHTMMYGKSGMLNHLKGCIPNLLDIRLD